MHVSRIKGKNIYPCNTTTVSFDSSSLALSFQTTHSVVHVNIKNKQTNKTKQKPSTQTIILIRMRTPIHKIDTLETYVDGSWGYNLLCSWKKGLT